MKIFINAKFFMLTCLLASVGMISSCKKEDSTKTSKIELLSFGPTGARHGDTLSFIGTNLQKVTEIALTGAAVPATSFVSQTYETIKLIVPTSTETGFVTLKTPDGDIVSKTKLNLEVAIGISSVTKEARPGSNITIKGNYLNWVTGITFAKEKAETTFVSRSLNELVIKVPMDAQTGTLFINYAGTKPMTVETDSILTVTLPMATAVSPVPVLHASNVTITGTNLDLVKAIWFTGVPAAVTAFVSQSATQIVVKVPAETVKGKLTLVALSGVKTESATELEVLLPALSKIDPNPIDPGANLTITGTNLDLVTSVAFENAPAVTSFISQSPTQIVVKAPMGILRGKITLGVVNSTVTVQSSDILEITGAVPPPIIALPIYNDAVTSNWTSTGWIGGGWGGTANRDNTSPVREGTKSVKIDYVGGYGSPLQLGGASLNTTGYTTFKVSLFGAPGSGGKKINIGINGSDKYTIILVEGKWTDYAIPLSDLLSGTNLNEILFKEYTGNGGFTVFVDALGLN